MAELTDEQKLDIDVRLPPEAWACEEVDDYLAALFRLIYCTGFSDGREQELKRIQGLRTPPRRPGRKRS